VIEHHPDVIRAADWIVELGPEGGPRGGNIVYQGPVSGLKKTKTATALIL
jgi:excinuclease ABC subunit A